MLRVAVINDYLSVVDKIADWSPLAGLAQVDFFRDHLADGDAAAARLAPYDVVVTERERTRFDRRLIERLPRLKLLVTTGPHNWVIDFAACAERGVVVSYTDAMMGATPEVTWGLLLALSRRIAWDHAAIRAGGWQSGLGISLRGKTLGTIGLGIVGRQIVDIAHVFGMKTIAWSRNLDAETARAAGTTLAGLDELLSQADVVTIHVVLSDRTRGLIGARELGLMKPSAYLINTSRGPIIDEAALIDALRHGRIAGAGLDVYDVEPLPPAHPLRGLDNVVLTPHTGYITDEQYRLFFTQAVENVVAFAKGAPIRIMTKP